MSRSWTCIGEKKKKLDTSAILFVRRRCRTGPARKGFGSSVERGGGGGADCGFNLCRDLFDAKAGTVVLAAEGGPRNVTPSTLERASFPNVRVHIRVPYGRRLPWSSPRAPRKGVPRCSEDAVAAIVVLVTVTYFPAPSRARASALS